MRLMSKYLDKREQLSSVDLSAKPFLSDDEGAVYCGLSKGKFREFAEQIGCKRYIGRRVIHDKAILDKALRELPTEKVKAVKVSPPKAKATWNKCEDRLPSSNEHYFVAYVQYEGRFGTTRYGCAEFCHAINGGYWEVEVFPDTKLTIVYSQQRPTRARKHTVVLAWMPIPSLPE